MSKGSEPSMEEILASIRKIVAEEPAAQSMVAQSPVAQPQMAAVPAAAPVDPQRTRADLDKDLADLLDTGEPAAPAQGANVTDEAQAPGKAAKSGWFFNRTAPAPAPEPAPSGGKLSETLELARANIRRATAAASKSPLARAQAAPETTNGAEPSRDLGAVVPHRYDGAAAAQAGRVAPAVTPHAETKAASPPAGAPFAATPAPAANTQWAAVANPLSATGAPRSPNPAANGHAAHAGRTLEDTVAELLKPMLRDWLDANMPRIMERVMREGGVLGSKPKS